MTAELIHSSMDEGTTERIVAFIDWVTICLDDLALMAEQDELDRPLPISTTELEASYETLESVLEVFASFFNVNLVHMDPDE